MRSPGRSRTNKLPISAWQRPSLFLLAGTGLLLLGLLAGFYLFFPAEALKQRIIQEVATRTKAEVQIEQVALYPLLTLDANRLRLAMAGLPEPLEIEQLRIAPQWLTLLSGDPGAQLQANLMNGTVTALIQKSGLLSAKATGLRFDLPLQKPLPLTLTATLNEATLDASTRLDPKAKTDLSLRLSDVRILGLDIFNADSAGITLGEIVLEVDGQGRAMRITSLTAKGGDLDVNGEGTLLIGRTAATSRIKLALQVRTGSNADPSIAALLELAGKPQSDGYYPLKFSGTLAKPILQPGG